MFTAKEAREKAENQISDKTKEELATAEYCINSAVQSGDMKCWCGKYLGKRAIGELEKLGYKVENHSNQMDGSTFLISW